MIVSLNGYGWLRNKLRNRGGCTCASMGLVNAEGYELYCGGQPENVRPTGAASRTSDDVEISTAGTPDPI